MLKFYLQLFVPLSILVPISMGGWFYRQLPNAMRWIWYYLLVTGVFNLTAILLSRFHLNNMPVFHVHSVAEFTCCTLFFSNALNKPHLTVFIRILIIAFAVMSILNVLLRQDIYSFNSLPHSTEAIVLILLCFVLMYHLLIPKSGDLLMNKPLLFICLGLFFYFCGSLFLFLFRDYLLTHPFEERFCWALHATLVLLMYILFSFAFYQPQKTT
ncbi:hypothetical protein BH11BAC7_BH11BAC7_25830 [soil metagenome]